MTDTITLPRSVVEQALEALNATMATHGKREWIEAAKQQADATLRSALEQPQVEQETVAWIEHEWSGSGLRHLHFERPAPTVRDEVVRPVWTPLYTHPQPKGEPPGSTESAYQRGYLDGMAKGRRDAALDAAEQQPVAWLLRDANNHKVWFLEKTGTPTGYRGEWIKTPLYTHPQPKRQPLTQEQIEVIEAGIWNLGSMDPIERESNTQFARAIERANGIGGDA